MKSLFSFKKDINNCSRCGLCQAVCPVYQVTKNDCTSPRGKFILINEILKNNSRPTLKLKKYMNMCINCGECVNYCPSKINILDINKVFLKNYPFLNFNILSFPILIKNFLNIICKILLSKKHLQKNKKIVYLASYNEKNIPEKIKDSNCIILKNCGISMKFAIAFPDLYKKISKLSTKKILDSNPDIIITTNPLCKTEIEIGMKLLNLKKKIIYLE